MFFNIINKKIISKYIMGLTSVSFSSGGYGYYLYNKYKTTNNYSIELIYNDTPLKI